MTGGRVVPSLRVMMLPNSSAERQRGTNRALNSWGKALPDPDLGDAIVDRVLERCAVLRMDGSSVRSRDVNPSDLEDPERLLSEGAIISGTATFRSPQFAPQNARAANRAPAISLLTNIERLDERTQTN